MYYRLIRIVTQLKKHGNIKLNQNMNYYIYISIKYLCKQFSCNSRSQMHTTNINCCGICIIPCIIYIYNII